MIYKTHKKKNSLLYSPVFWLFLCFVLPDIARFYHFLFEEILSAIFKGENESEVDQSCPTLCSPMDCSLPGSSVHGIFQAIVLEWIAISFSRGSSQPRSQTPVSRIVDRHLLSEPPGKSFFFLRVVLLITHSFSLPYLRPSLFFHLKRQFL